MIKTYRNNNPFNLSTSVNGKNTESYLVDFTGYSNGRGYQANRSEFTTDNKELQEAIESDPRYGKTFICTSPLELEVEKTIKEDSSTTTTPVDRSINTTRCLDESLEVGGVTNTQMAIEWLAINKEHKFTTRPSKAEVVSTAASLGVVFVDWK